jgi:hypothetical protein
MDPGKLKNLTPRTRVLWLALALVFAMVCATAILLCQPRGKAAQRVAQAEHTGESAGQDRRVRELEAGVKQFSQVMREARAFEAWIRDARPKIKARQARSSFGKVECHDSRNQGQRPQVVCFGVHLPYGTASSIRYELAWYRDHPADMRATASGVPHSPLVNCEALGLRQKQRFTQDDGGVTTLHCEIADSTESYAVRHSVRAGAKETTLWWFSSHYLTRDVVARRELRLSGP